VELGVKTDLGDGRLSLSAALFEITKDNARIPDPANPGLNTLGGEQRVRGVSVDVAGMVAERLYVASGYSYLDSEVVRGANAAAAGAPLANAPEHSVNVWANYRITPRFDFGVGARYVSEQFAQSAFIGRAQEQRGRQVRADAVVRADDGPDRPIDVPAVRLRGARSCSSSTARFNGWQRTCRSMRRSSISPASTTTCRAAGPIRRLARAPGAQAA
jgi:hypothetical protein